VTTWTTSTTDRALSRPCRMRLRRAVPGALLPTLERVALTRRSSSAHRASGAIYGVSPSPKGCAICPVETHLIARVCGA